jgi:hypothetical protein
MVDLSQPANCGACDVACSDPTPLCAPFDQPGSYTCVATCPAQAPNACSGRCVDFAKDAGNCGGCGHACGAQQVCSKAVCVNLAGG